jgi:hypothetical protein
MNTNWRSCIMAPEELSALLDGAAGATLTLSGPDGPINVAFNRHDLETPAAWRAAMRRALGHVGYEPPHYDQADHDQFVRVLFALADAEQMALSVRRG